MSNHIPLSLRKYVSLSTFFKILGRHLFPKRWSGDELNTPIMLSFDDAKKLEVEEREKRRALRRVAQRSDDAFIKESVELNELTGNLDQEILNDPDSAYDEFSHKNLIYKLDSIIKYFSDKPNLDDCEAYEIQFCAYERRTKTINALTALLQNDSITAYCSGETGREPVSSDIWKAKDLLIDTAKNSARFGGKSKNVLGIEFKKSDVEDLLRRLPTQGSSTAATQRDKETRAEEYLEKLMRDPQQKRLTKLEARHLVGEKYPGLSKRAFYQVWSQACKYTGSGWDQPGRHKLSKP